MDSTPDDVRAEAPSGSARTQSGNLSRIAGTGALWTFVQVFGARIASVATFVILARLLEPRAFGLVATASVFVTICQTIAEQGFGNALIQRDQVEPGHYNAVFWVSMATGIALGAVLALAAGPLSASLHQAALAPILRVMALVLPVSAAASVPTAILSRALRFRAIAVRGLLADILSGAAGVCAALIGMGAWSLVVQALSMAAIGTVVVAVAARWWPGITTTRRHLSELTGFSLRLLGVNLLGLASRRSDDLTVAFFLGPVPLALYRVAYRVLSVLTELMIQSVQRICFTVFSRVQDDEERIARGYLKATRLTVAVAMPVFVAVAVLAPEIVDTTVGPKWRASVPVIQILTFIGILFAAMYVNRSVLLARGRADITLKISIINAVANVIGFLIAVHWGIFAVATSYVVRGYVFMPIWLWVTRSVVGVSLRSYLGGFIGPVAAGAVMAVATFLLRQLALGALPSAVLLVTVGIAAFAVYLAALSLVSPMLARELFDVAHGLLPDMLRRRGRRQSPLGTQASTVRSAS